MINEQVTIDSPESKDFRDTPLAGRLYFLIVLSWMVIDFKFEANIN